MPSTEAPARESVTGGRPLLSSVLVSLASVLAMLPVVLGLHRFFLPIDLLVYQAGGEAVRLGLPLYDGTLTYAGFETLDFTYPPVAALLFAPLSLLEPVWATLLVTLLTVVALTVVVTVSFRPLLLRVAPTARPWVLAGLTGAAVLTLPVAHVVSFGQVGVFVVLACLWDLARVRGPWRGVLIGVATAVKLVPGLFVVHLVVTRQWRAALTAVATTLTLWVGAAALLPDDSRRYFLDRVMLDSGRVTPHPDLVTNQSLAGLLERWGGGSWWLPVAVVVAVVGLWRAARAHRQGDQVAAAVLVGLTSLLVSPVSWVHHAVWLVPAIGVVLSEARSRGRTAAAVVAWLVACLAPVGPVVAELIVTGEVVDPPAVALLRESLVVLYLVLLVALPVGAPSGRRAPAAASRPSS